MASQLSDERTPFRAVQPDLVAQDVGDAKRASTPRKAEGAEAHLRCDDDIENAFAEIPLGGEGVVDEPEIRQSESPKRALVHSVARPATGRRQRAARSGMRSSVRHSLRTSMAMDANPAIRTSMASGGELFTREVFDVHSEIDKLLGGLKTELDNWRTEFESLQIYWFTHVMCVPDHPGGDLPLTDRVHLRSLYEFQALLERHIDETEYDIQDLEKRLKASEEDRCELQCLLEEGSLEVHYLETKQADSQREHGKRTNALQTRIKQAEREVMQCKKDMASRDQELEEMRKQVVEASEQVHAMESEASKAKAELKSANSKIQVYEDQIASVRKEFSGVAEANNEVQLQCKMLQASLDSKNDECKRITAELHCKSEEMRLLSKSIAQYEQRITDLQTEATDSFQMCLEKKERLQDDEKRIGLLEDSQKRLQAQVTSLSQKLKERESEVVGLRKELDVVTVAKEDLEKEVDSLGRAVDEKETDSIKHSKELKKIVSYLDQAKRELKEATVNEISLAEQIDALRAQCEDQRTEIRALAEEKTAMQDLFDQKSSQAAETKHALEERMRGYQEESERSKGEIEERLEAHYKQVISELEAHYGTLSSEKEKAFEGELARTKELLQENKNRAAEERNAMEISWKKKCDVRVQQVKNEMSERLLTRERELIDERNSALAAMETAHEKAVEAAAAEAAAVAAAERARRFEFEEAQRGRTERAIRDALKTADDATTEMRKRFQEEREDLSDQMLKQEQEFKAALAEAWEEKEKLRNRERSMRAEMNSRFESVTRVMQEMQLGFGGSENQ